MNSAVLCHRIEGCPGLFVDAFRPGLLQRETRKEHNAFILTHYHGDHYGNLPRDYKYQGPAKIHCTPVTAALLRKVHLVKSEFVVEHAYGETWTFDIPKDVMFADGGGDFAVATTAATISGDEAASSCDARITFYDANHCPGAAIVVICLAAASDGGGLKNNKYHLHCGDMRYDSKMESYSELVKAVQTKSLDLVYLDTTYAHPKHNFCPQEEAIEEIAESVQTLLSEDGEGETLILLSCYSIGKERVLWEAAKRTNQMIFAPEKKRKLLECVQLATADEGEHCQILQKCTDDPCASDIHIIPMGLAGELWPYFRPDYFACMEYAKELNSKSYKRVVAFLPTGWAAGSNWNKKHAISQQVCKGVTVEIRLVPYSEHSTFDELETFLKFLRPRKIIPTVFGDEKDRRKIEGLFRHVIDSNRAKQSFINMMTSKQSSPSATGTKRIERPSTASLVATKKRSLLKESSSSPRSTINKGRQPSSVVASKKRSFFTPIIAATKDEIRKKPNEEHVSTLMGMGFDRKAASKALVSANNDLQLAIHQLLG